VADLTLAEAARELRISPSTLRNQVKAGRLRGRLVGKTYVTTSEEVERYRRESLGRVGRPPRLAAGPSAGSPAAVEPARLESIAARYGIRSFALFGSAARGEAGPESDVDIVIELEPTSTMGLLEHARVAEELSRVFGRPVDLVTWNALRPRMRADVEREAITLYPR
jgi:predicted nucleotidyltransferase